MRVTCAISGLRFSISYLEGVTIQHTEGYFHPVFAIPYKSLHRLYSQHCRGQLTPTDSYLLFLSFLHSTGQVNWKYPANLKPNESSTKAMIENNLSQLIAVTEKSNLIRHPSFKQPSFSVSYDNSALHQIPNWIEAWDSNIERFKLGIASVREQQELQEVENKLSYLILSGEKPERMSAVIANWASLAAEFPPDKNELYQKTIRSCFSMSKMFSTPLPLLKEIKDFCECNIEVGSIHFHSLSNVLREGIARHHDYLGGSSLATGYTMLPTLREVEPNNMEAKVSKEKTIENEKYLLSLAEAADTSLPAPIQADYSSTIEYIKAKLAYRVALNLKKTEVKVTIPNAGEL